MEKVIQEIEAWWQERRIGMDTAVHNAELELVEKLKARILTLEEKLQPVVEETKEVSK